VLLALATLIILVGLLLYVPAVQRFAVNKVEKIVENATGMKLSVGQFRLRFPLGVGLDDISVVTPVGDTLVAFERARLVVAVWPLLAGEVHIPRISMENTRATYRDTTSAMLLSARFASFNVRGVAVRLRDNAVRIDRTSISGVGALLEMGKSQVPKPATSDTIVSVSSDTTVSAGWNIELRRTELREVDLAMHTSPDNTDLTVHLPNGLVKKAAVDLTSQSVAVDKIRLIEGFYSYLTSPMAPTAQENASEPTVDTLPWSVKVGSIELIDNGALYGTLDAIPQAGFDPAYIAVDSLQLWVEDVMYSGSDISARLSRLGLRERSGLVVTSGEGDFAMNSDDVTLDNFVLATPHSTINASAQFGEGVLQMAPQTTIEAIVSATADAKDLLLFVPLDIAQKRALEGKSLTLEGDFAGTLADISINRLTATIPRTMKFSVRGDIASLMAPERLGGRLTFNGEVRNLDFAREFIADTLLRRRIGFPDKMTLAGRASLFRGVYDLPKLVVTADEGEIDAAGRLDMRDTTYRATVEVTDFPLYRFLPADSLGVATLRLTAEGRGLDPTDDMAAKVGATIDRLDYQGYNFGELTTHASIAEGQIAGTLDSRSEALVFNFALDGHISPDKYAAHLKGKIGKADIYGMGFATDAMSVTSVVDIAASTTPDTTRICFTARATLDSTIVHYGTRTQRIASTRITASADSLHTVAAVRSGDLSVDFTSPASIDSLARCFTATSGELARQFTERNFYMDSIQRRLPEVTLSASAGRGNALRDFARASGMDFRRLSANVSTSPVRPLRAGFEVDGFHTGTLTLDTINVWVRQRDDRLAYSARLANRPGNIESLALIYAYGSIEENRARLNVMQRNRADSVGFFFGVDARMSDSVIRANVVPVRPTLGYEQWTVNEDNYIMYGFDGSLAGNLHLEGPHHNHIILQSVGMKDIPGALNLDIKGIEIEHLLELVPTAPPVGGELSTDIAFGLHQGAVATTGTVGIDNLVYDGHRVADLSGWVDFYFEETGLMALESSLDIDQKTAITAKGTYLTEGDGEMDFTVDVPALPLGVVNAFIPDGMATLAGNLTARLAVKGSPKTMTIEGDSGFIDGKVAVDMTGTTLGLSTDRITVADGRVNFNGFGVTAPNGEKLRITGGLDIRDFDNMKADMGMAARNFQVINSTHIGGSQVYGKAAFDANVTARGPLDALTVRGDVKLRSSTDVTYIMRDQLEAVSDQRQDIVEFMVFADSLFMETYAPVENLRRESRIDMLVGVEIEEGLKAAVNLDELGDNRVALVGGGRLSYSMNSQGDMRLAGRYTLSGGTVVYKPPVISRKEFDVEDGSYVAFTGEVTDPEFHVTATQTMSVEVDMGSGAEPVGFDITISIEGSLHGMQITFDVAAPSNAAIQSQLMSMAPEQRMQQALSLLLYNQYTGPGATTATAAFDARNQLNSFISKEVNQWARNNLRGVDLSVGIDTRDDETGSSYTDYSYSVSKKLFSDRVTVKIGGSVSDNATAQTFSDNLVDDITLEYRLTKRDNMFLKVYHYNTQETIFEGEVTETGAGFLMRKKINRLRDLFRLQGNRKRHERQPTTPPLQAPILPEEGEFSGDSPPSGSRGEGNVVDK
jgi:hypothetical protein